jgi:RNA polymerase sigma-70 factor (ECF subfamily)
MKTDASLEKKLLDGAKRYNQEALAAIYDRFSPGIYAYSLRLLGDVDLAEECTGETFSRFLRALRSGSGPQEYLQAYLYRIAHNWITDHYRRQTPQPLELDENLQADESEAPQQTADQHFGEARIRAALQQLTPDQRQVIILRYIEDWDNQEVASALDKPIGAIKALQHRALEALRKVLTGDHEL